MTEQSDAPMSDAHLDSDETGIVGWLRWWHWLILIGMLLFGLAYFPLWQFDRRWRQVSVGDSLDDAKVLLGDPGDATYSVQGFGPSGAYEGYVFSRYWRTYELVVSSATQRVISKSISNTPPPQAPSVVPGVGGGAVPVKKKKR